MRDEVTLAKSLFLDICLLFVIHFCSDPCELYSPWGIVDCVPYFCRRTIIKDFLWWVFATNIYLWYLQQFSCMLKVEKFHYLPPTKLCVCVCLFTEGSPCDSCRPVQTWSLRDPLPPSISTPLPTWGPLSPPEMFKFVHLGKRVIGLRLKGLLVLRYIDIYGGCTARTAWSSLSTFNCCNLCSYFAFG